jgi:hypothetical protein
LKIPSAAGGYCGKIEERVEISSLIDVYQHLRMNLNPKS